MLREHAISPTAGDNGWHLPAEEILGAVNEAFIIDLKPKQRVAKGKASRYEIRDACGVNNDGWTPLMLRVRGLIVDGEPEVGDTSDFVIGGIPSRDESFL